MAEHVFADPTRKTPVKPTVETQQKETTPPQVESNSFVDLQRLIGNQGLQRMLAQRQIQAKLTVGAADDAYEQEADRVAQEVVSGNATDTAQREAEEDEMMLKRVDVQREALPEEEEMMLKRADIQREGLEEDEMMLKRADIQREGLEEDEMMLKRADIQRADVDMSGSFDVDDNVESQINGLKGGGQALSGDTKDFMESNFGQDFGNVRVHTSSESDTLNRSIGARAFTTGSDIFMRSDEYKPDTTDGKELLAHELTHVVQQTGGKAQAKRDDCENC